METPGSFIKRERELRGISLNEIAAETKIGNNYLHALEEDNYDSLPAPTFIKGFLRAYSKHIGLDENDVVLRYEDFIERTTEKKEVVVVDEKVTQPANRKYYLTAIIAGAGLLILILLSLYVFWPDNSSTIKQSEAEQETSEQVLEKIESPKTADIPQGNIPNITATIEETISSISDIPVKEISQKKHSLSFSASQETWLLVMIDDTVVKDIILKQGENIKWEGEKGFQVTIGNAGGVKAVFNGKPLELPGKTGKVVRLTLP